MLANPVQRKRGGNHSFIVPPGLRRSLLPSEKIQQTLCIITSRPVGGCTIFDSLNRFFDSAKCLKHKRLQQFTHGERCFCVKRRTVREWLRGYPLGMQRPRDDDFHAPAPTADDFAARLRAYRVGAGLTRRELADRVGMSETVLTEIETGRRTATTRQREILLRGGVV